MCDDDDDIFSFKSLRRIGRSVFNGSVTESTESTNNLDEKAESKTSKSKTNRSVKQTQSKSVNSESFIKQKHENSFATKQNITKKKPELSKLRKCKSHDVKLTALAKDSVTIDKLKNRQSNQKIKIISGKSKDRECLSTNLKKLGYICSQSLPMDSKETMVSASPQRLHSQSVSPKASDILPETLSGCVLVSKISLATQLECSIFSKVSSNKSPDCDGNNATDGRCPFCQMPFSILRLESPNSHTMQCMDIPLKTTEECSAGLYCDSTIPSHYRRFLHSDLAMQLSGLTQEHAVQEHFIEGVSSCDNCSQNISECKESRGAICSSTKRKLFTSCSKGKKFKVVTDTQTSQGDGSPRSSSMLVYLSPTDKNGNPHSSSKDDLETRVEKPTTHLPVSDSITTRKISFSSGNNFCMKERVTESEPVKANFKASPNEVTGNNSGVLSEADNSELSENETIAIFSEDLQRYGRNKGNSLEESLIPNSVSVVPSKSCSAPSSQESVVPSELPQTGLRRQMSLFSFFQPHCHTTKQTQHLLPEIIKKPLNKLSPKVDQNSDHEAVSHMKFHISKNASELTLNVISPALSSLPAFPQKNSRSGIRRENSEFSRSMLPVQRRNSGKQCPFYKKIPGTKITVDAFSYGHIEGCEAYVLTHFHSDHYNGLNKRFSQPIFCSPVTGNLVEKQLGVASCWINRLPLNKQCQVTDVWLTLMEANHCPGAVIILFELPNGKKILHTGDFRADTSMESYPALTNIRVDELYLDTTYCNAGYAFPPQSEVVQFAVATALKAVQKEPKTLVICGAYTIGKERIFAALAEALQSKVCVQATKKRILDCLEDPQLQKIVSVHWSDGCVHVLPMGQLNAKCLEAHLQQCPQFSSVLAFEPTGWTYKKNCLSLENIRPKYSRSGITVYGIPYSEHSSFLEMKRFVQFLQPKKIIPTVNNGSLVSRRKMEAVFKQWLSEQTADNTGAKFIPRKSSQQYLGYWLRN